MIESAYVPVSVTWYVGWDRDERAGAIVEWRPWRCKKRAAHIMHVFRNELNGSQCGVVHSGGQRGWGWVGCWHTSQVGMFNLL